MGLYYYSKGTIDVSWKTGGRLKKVVELMRYIQIFLHFMGGFYTTKIRYKVLAARKRAVDYTDKFENFLSIIIGVLTTIVVLRALLQAIT